MPDCPVCGTPLADHQEQLQHSLYSCPRCGDFGVPGLQVVVRHGFADLFNLPDAAALHRRSQLSHILRRQARPRRRTVATIEEMQGWPLDAALPDVVDQIDELILWAGSNQISPEEWAKSTPLALSAHLGMRINAANSDDALIWLCNQPIARERFLFEYLRPPDAFAGVRLHFPGWERYRELTHSRPRSDMAFMAMKFGEPELDRVVADCFRPAALRAGFTLRVLTDQQPAGSIDDQLRVGLRASRLVIADLTHANRGAYWEAGFAEGLGRPVIYSCRADVWDAERTHFDTNHLATIIWEPLHLTEAGQKLTNMIRATLPGEARLTDT